MNKKNKQFINGFTIIEISLFLGLSGLLAVGLMAGWSNSINRQRYNDMVSTFKSEVQQVFFEVENPKNDLTQKIRCTDNGTNISIVLDDSGNSRGTTDCIILGKMINFANPSPFGLFRTHYDTSRYVIGLDINTSTACGGKPCENDIDALKATKYVVATGKNSLSTKWSDTGKWDEQPLEWDGRYKAITDNRTTSGSSRKFSGDLTSPWSIRDSIFGIMILRSPINGSVLAFGVPIGTMGPGNQFYNNENLIASFRNSFTDSRLLLNNNKKVDICVMPNADSYWARAGVSIFGRGKVLRIGNTSSSVEIAPLDGPGSVSCDNQNGFEGVSWN